LFFILAVSFLGTASFAQQINDPNAEIREAKNFHAIKVSHAFDVYLSQSNEEAVAVSASDDEAKQHIKVDVDGGVLIISFDADSKFWKKWKGNKKLKAYVSFKSLDKIVISGACDVNFVNGIKSENLSVHLSGASLKRNISFHFPWTRFNAKPLLLSYHILRIPFFYFCFDTVAVFYI
jgi:hypothetical protein